VRHLLVVFALAAGFLAPTAAAGRGPARAPAIRGESAPMVTAAKPAVKKRGALRTLGARLGLARAGGPAEPLAVAAPTGPPRPPRTRMTHERVAGEVGAPVGPLDVGVTFSQLEKVRRRGGPELVHVVAPDGGSNVELILARLPFFRRQFLEVQGPAINRSAGGRLGVRVVGLGLTGDLDEVGSIKAASYTAEVKLTERGLAGIGVAIAPAAMGRLGAATTGFVSDVIAVAVPGISLYLAARSIGHAWRTLRDPRQDRRHKFLASAHAVADSVRVLAPMVGVAANLTLILGNAVVELDSRRRAAVRGPATLASTAQ
jgi:hypothetical protein